jgi:hypothetical protein
MKQALINQQKSRKRNVQRFDFEGEKYRIGKTITPKIIKEIVHIQKSEGLTPFNVVKRARDKQNILHNLFEWNDAKASEKYRLHQAISLIGQIEVEVKGSLFPRYENVVVVKRNGTAKREYYDNKQIISNEELRRQMLQIALSHLEGWKMKFQYYNELKPIVVSIDTTKDKLERKWQRKNKK